jgi:hemolysin-activating ACP:hemolysin acyltransferase
MKLLNDSEALVQALELFRASPAHSKYNVNDIYTYLQLPIKHKCIRFYYSNSILVGLITWCWLSDTDAELFLQDKYHPTELDYASDSPMSRQLWGMEFIAPYGHTRQMMRSIKQSIQDTYGPQKVHWRRFHSRDKIRSKRFKA